MKLSHIWLTILVYLLVGGALAGLLMNPRPQCPQDSVRWMGDQEYAATVLLWPAMLASAIVIDDNRMVPTGCRSAPKSPAHIPVVPENEK